MHRDSQQFVNVSMMPGHPEAPKPLYFVVFWRHRALFGISIIKNAQGFSSSGIKIVRRARVFESRTLPRSVFCAWPSAHPWETQCRRAASRKTATVRNRKMDVEHADKDL